MLVFQGSQYFYIVFPRFICIFWDKSSVTVLNTGACRNVFMQSCLCEIRFLSASNQFELICQNLPSEQNIIADWLFRWSLGEYYHESVLEEANRNSWEEVSVPDRLFQFSAPW